MANLTQLRFAAPKIFDEALQAVDAVAAIRSASHLDASRLSICNKTFELPPDAGVFSVAIGKAAVAMAIGLEDVLGNRLAEGIVSGPALHGGPRKLSNRWQYFAGGHPVPNEASLAAAKAVFDLLDRANKENAFVIFLVSGGGSAMLEAPIADDITLDDLRAANQVLVECGASISEINAVRRAFSAVKGGQLAARAPNCRQITLIVSDVPKGQEQNVASGPTLSPSEGAPAADAAIAQYGLRDKLPASIVRAIDCPAAPAPPPDSHAHFVLLENNTALEAAGTAARKSGLTAEIARDISDEPIESGVDKLLTRLGELRISKGETDVCLISGGEFACPVRGDGIGGRNLETALRLAIAFDQNPHGVSQFVALCAGTDGIDGNSPAAGASVDSTTIERARQIGLDPNDFLNRSDAYSFFVALGDAITTGPTGTNVRDLRILLSSNSKTVNKA